MPEDDQFIAVPSVEHHMAVHLFSEYASMTVVGQHSIIATVIDSIKGSCCKLEHVATPDSNTEIYVFNHFPELLNDRN
jgi:hypothetical protein